MTTSADDGARPHIDALGRVRALSVTPDAIVTGDMGGIVRWWQRTSGTQLAQQSQGAEVRALAVLADGAVVSGDGNGSITRWSAGGDHTPTSRQSSGSAVTCLAVTPKNQVVSGHEDGRIRIWPADPPHTAPAVLDNSEPVKALVAVGNRIVAGSVRGTVRLWTTENGRFPSSPQQVAASERPVAALAAVGDLIAISRRDPWEVLLVDAHNLEPRGQLSAKVNTLAAVPGESFLVGGGGDGVLVWALPGDDRGQPLPGCDQETISVAVAQDDGRWIAAASDTKVRVWRNSAELHGVTRTRHKGIISDIAVLSTGEFVSAGGDGLLWLWHEERPTRRVDTGQPVTAIAVVDERAKQIVTATGVAGAPMAIRTLTDLDYLVGELRQTQNGVCSLAVTSVPGQLLLISGGYEGTIQLWDPVERTPIGKAREAHAGRPVVGLAVADNGRLVSAGGRSIKLWNTLEGTLIGEWSQPADVRSVATSSDGRWLVAGDNTGTARVWRIADSGTLEYQWSARDVEQQVAVAILTGPDGRDSVFAAGSSGLVREWDLKTGRSVVGPPRWASFQEGVSVLRPDPSGRRLIAGGNAGEVRIVLKPRMPPDPDVLPSSRVPDPEVLSDQASLQDLIGIGRDVTAMAALIAAKRTTAPLSIAVLGEWGAGKSTFLNLVAERVKNLSSAAEKADGDVAYVRGIRQIRFNAWHYSDDHIWTGLIEHLFTELAAPADPDGSGWHEIQRQEAHAERDRLRLQHEALHAQITAIKETKGPGVGAGYLKLARIFRQQSPAPGHGRRNLHLQLATGMVAVVTIVAVGMEVFQRYPHFFGIFPAVATGVAAVVTRLHKGYQKFTAGAAEAEKVADAHVKKMEVDEKKLEARIQELGEELRKNQSLDDQFRALLTEIGAPERFARYRGLVGELHRDLRRLAEMLAKSNGDTAGRKDRIGRIVLYIDDLDRCVPQRVIEVLHAINLLLAWPVFVVVVAVDTPWLMGSLEQSYDGLLATEGPAEPTRYTTQSLSFLDKIFHIPFALEPVSDMASAYLARLLPPVRQPSRPPEQPAGRISRRPTSEPSEDAVDERTTPGTPVVVTERHVAPTTVSMGDVASTTLQITQVEADFLPRLACLLSRPRELKKLANLYQLVRFGQYRAIEAFEAGPCQAVALLLAAMINAPKEFSDLARLLMGADPERDILESLCSWRTLTGRPTPPVAERLATTISTIRADGVTVHGQTGTYAHWVVRVARYGFATYPIFIHRGHRPVAR